MNGKRKINYFILICCAILAMFVIFTFAGIGLLMNYDPNTYGNNAVPIVYEPAEFLEEYLDPTFDNYEFIHYNIHEHSPANDPNYKNNVDKDVYKKFPNGYKSHQYFLVDVKGYVWRYYPDNELGKGHVVKHEYYYTGKDSETYHRHYTKEEFLTGIKTKQDASYEEMQAYLESQKPKHIGSVIVNINGTDEKGNEFNSTAQVDYYV
jgi:hypothetical protein